jgi:hypothetical protein
VATAWGALAVGVRGEARRVAGFRAAVFVLADVRLGLPVDWRSGRGGCFAASADDLACRLDRPGGFDPAPRFTIARSYDWL